MEMSWKNFVREFSGFLFLFVLAQLKLVLLLYLKSLLLSLPDLTECYSLFLRCFDKVFRRPYQYFSIALKGILSMSDRYKISASD